MKTLPKLSVFLIIFILAFSAIVFAAGGGGGGGSSSGGSSGGSGGASDSSTITVVQKVNCETKATLIERVKCRLENKDRLLESANYTEEACRNHSRTQECVELYKVSEVCYQLSGIEKHRCFISRSGVDENRNLSASTEESKRNYIILLLYDLQEKIEDRQANGQVSTEKAAEVVSRIIGIKRDILTDRPKNDIRTKIRELKSVYNT